MVENLLLVNYVTDWLRRQSSLHQFLPLRFIFGGGRKRLEKGQNHYFERQQRWQDGEDNGIYLENHAILGLEFLGLDLHRSLASTFDPDWGSNEEVQRCLQILASCNFKHLKTQQWPLIKVRRTQLSLHSSWAKEKSSDKAENKRQLKVKYDEKKRMKTRLRMHMMLVLDNLQQYFMADVLGAQFNVLDKRYLNKNVSKLSVEL